MYKLFLFLLFNMAKNGFFSSGFAPAYSHKYNHIPWETLDRHSWHFSKRMMMMYAIRLHLAAYLDL